VLLVPLASAIAVLVNSWINTEELISSGSGQHTEADTDEFVKKNITILFGLSNAEVTICLFHVPPYIQKCN